MACRIVSTHRKKRAAKKSARAKGGRVVGKRGCYRVVKCSKR